jgi:LacI family transcriptional regulator
MLEVLDRGDPLANCYFAENDLIAIGAMKAFKQRGYRIPEDIAIVGFDNISEGQVMEPALTTVNIPRTYMGRVAVRCLINAIQDGVPHHIKVEVSTDLVIRSSVVRSSHTP